MKRVPKKMMRMLYFLLILPAVLSLGGCQYLTASLKLPIMLSDELTYTAELAYDEQACELDDGLPYEIGDVSRDEVEEIGTSGAGRPINAYHFGSGRNVLLMTFCMHGFDDAFDRDGAEMSYVAIQLMRLLSANPNLVTDGDWTVYIIPVVNPDGLYDGTQANGDGRRTTYSRTGDTLVPGGIDINRSFPFLFQADDTARTYTGDEPLSSKESQILYDFTQRVRGDGNNVCIDTHGWLSQLLVSGGEDSKLYKAFSANFPQCTYGNLERGYGYYTAWAGYELNYDVLLMEFPEGATSHDTFIESDLIPAYLYSVIDILENYNTAG